MSRVNILIAEDDPRIACDLRKRLTSLDYGVQGPTARGRGAIAIAERLRPNLVLLDIGLKGDMDGIQAAEELRKFQIPVVFVTGHAEGPIFDRAKLAEPYGYVLKPYDERTLRISIELALVKHQAEQERREQICRLHDALTEAKVLMGLVSICSYCKKVKDQTGAWEQLEAYIMKRSGLSFTHGFCPECIYNMMNKDRTPEAG
jgi:CheY-like chemotaxis protein